MKLTQGDLRQFVDSQRSADYKSLIWYVLRDFVGHELNEVEIKRYAKSRYKNPNSHNLALALFKSLANWKMKRLDQSDLRQYIRDRQALELIRDIKRERIVKKIEERSLTSAELEKVLMMFPPDGLEFSTLFLLAYTGARPGELVEIEPKMVDWKQNVLTLTTEKTRVQRENPLSPIAAKCIRKFLEARPSYAYVYKLCVETGKKIKKKLTPKTFRSTFRTLMDHRLAELGVRPLRGDLLIKVSQGHTVNVDMAGVYGDFSEDIKKMFIEWHFLNPLEKSF